MTSDKNEQTTERRMPPRHGRFIKGRSGNPKGRPRGSIDINRLTRIFALKKMKVTSDGKKQNVTRLELIVKQLRKLNMLGKPNAVKEYERVCALIKPSVVSDQRGVMVVAEPLSSEEWIARALRKNARYEEMEAIRFRDNPDERPSVAGRRYLQEQ